MNPVLQATITYLRGVYTATGYRLVEMEVTLPRDLYVDLYAHVPHLMVSQSHRSDRLIPAWFTLHLPDIQGEVRFRMGTP